MERSSSATQVPGTLVPEPREQHSTGELIKMMTEQMSVLVSAKADVEEIKERAHR
jgi:hypothetical protein